MKLQLGITFRPLGIITLVGTFQQRQLMTWHPLYFSAFEPKYNRRVKSAPRFRQTSKRTFLSKDQVILRGLT